MSSGGKDMREFANRIGELTALNDEIAKEAERGVAGAVRETARAGTDPYGDPWPELKEGGKALRGAADAIESSVQGRAITLKVGAPYVYHQHGAGGSSTTKAAERARKRAERKRAKSGKKSKFHAPQRMIIPTYKKDIPEGIRTALKAAAERVFTKIMGGK